MCGVRAKPARLQFQTSGLPSSCLGSMTRPNLLNKELQFGHVNTSGSFFQVIPEVPHNGHLSLNIFFIWSEAFINLPRIRFS